MWDTIVPASKGEFEVAASLISSCYSNNKHMQILIPRKNFFSCFLQTLLILDVVVMFMVNLTKRTR